MRRIAPTGSTTLRMAALAALVVATAVLLSGTAQPSPAAAQGAGIVNVAFSREKTADNQPIAPATSFLPPVDRVWVTFEYRGLPAGARLARVVRYNGQDVSAGDLACCPDSGGRYAFPIAASAGNVLAEGGWEVSLVVGDTPIAAAGFEVANTPGSRSSGAKHSADSDDNDNGSDNDNS